MTYRLNCELMKKLYFCVFLLCLGFIPLSAFEDMLKLPSRELFIKQGYPDDMLPLRGESEPEDAILISYNDGLSFVIWENHVTEIRIDKRYRRDIMGLYMGMTSSDVKKAAAVAPVKEADGEMILIKNSPTGKTKLDLFFLEDQLVNLSITLAID